MPPWFSEAERELMDLEQLPEDWNSYGGRPLDSYIVHAGLELLRSIVTDRTPRPTTVPTVAGGVQFEWHVGGIDLEIEVSPPDLIQVLHEEGEDSTESELPLTEASKAVLRELVAHLPSTL
jgi:hypothetical protein